MKISTKMVMLVAVPLLGMLVLLAVAVPLIARVKVGGPEYNKIAQAAALKADILPPPEYLVEAMLVVNQLATGQNPASTALTVTYLEGLKTQYYERYQYWSTHLTFAEIKGPFLTAAFAPADLFWKEVDEKFLPAIKEGRLSDAQVIAYTDLTSLYKQHRDAINNTVKLADRATALEEADVQATVSSKVLTMVLLLVAVAAGVLLLGIAFGRAISLPIRRLTKRAEKAAHEDLPRVIEEVQNSPIDAEVSTVEPFPVDGQEELGDLARAFNAMQDTSIRLATQQARMRRNVSEMFANLGRRNQGLLNRTISLISELEQSERDPKMLEDLFRIDHLTTRIRRNAESLLVLAGSDQNRMWSKPVEIGDVIRTALSAIESYDRVDFDQVQPVQLRGNVVNDVAHLFAELIENATNFSPPSTRVSIVGKLIHDGYVLSIIDQGLGMSPVELAEAQGRIDEINSFDMAPSKVLGLNVVGRIAVRLGISVRLTESPSDGVTAKVRLPFSLIDGRDRDAKPAVEPESLEPATFAEYASAPVSALATATATATPSPRFATPTVGGDSQSLHDFAMEWTTSLPPPEPGTMFSNDYADEIGAAEAAAAEHTAVLAKELATGDDRPRALKRRRGNKQHDITSRQLPPLYDWTAAAEAAETVGQDHGIAAAPAASAHDWNDAPAATPATVAPDRNVGPASPTASARDDDADLWGVGSDATASPAPAPVTDHAEPAAAPAEHVWGIHDWGATPAAPVQAAPEFETLVAFEAPAAPSPPLLFVAPVVPLAPAVAEEPTPVGAAVEPDEDAVEVVAAASMAPSTNAAGLAKRVRGAHMPDTGPAMGAVGDPNRSADGVRSALSRFQSGVRKGQEDAGQDPDD
jgi:signal transduction histidine kinase